MPPVSGPAERPWQLRLFDKTLKKKQKLALLRRLLGTPESGDQLLLLTNGDNNGAMNCVCREWGGRWTWGECEASSIPEMAQLLGEPVVHCDPDHLNFPDNTFDTVIVIDVHEHLNEPRPLNRELFRIIRPGGRAIVTTPNGDLRKLAVRIKDLVGMTKDAYGHVRVGYTIPEHSQMLSDAGFHPEESGSYSQFPTEMIELGINLAYVKFLSRRKKGASTEGEHGVGPIAPSSQDQVRKVEKTLKLYGAIYPICRALSSFDVFFAPFTTGYAVAVVGHKPSR
ncbi:MAG TPA: methyltransferase domain-containing protein [Gemmatimonadales bacterium]|jgi:SAM-dependent methyltransferase